MTDKPEDQTAEVDPKKQKNDQLVTASKQLAAQGFNKEQIARQLSSKYQISIAEATAVVDQDKEDDK